MHRVCDASRLDPRELRNEEKSNASMLSSLLLEDHGLIMQMWVFGMEFVTPLSTVLCPPLNQELDDILLIIC